MGIDGVSIGSNDLTQLMLGADRASDICAELFDESSADGYYPKSVNPNAITAARRAVG
jgi:PEP-utilising enzyme, PEP-binding domain